MTLICYAACGIALFSALLVILQRNPMHALLYLILMLLALGLVFFALGAPFVGILQVIIYAGAIMVLFVFVVMMLNLGPPAERQESHWLNIEVWLIPAILTTALLALSAFALSTAAGTGFPTAVIGAKEVGLALYGKYVLAVEIASLVLLAGLIGAFHLAPPACRYRPTEELQTGEEELGDEVAQISPLVVLYLALALFMMGLLGVLIRRDLLFVLMSLEIMLNGAALGFIAAGAKWRQVDAQVMVIIILVAAAAEIGVGLSLLLRIYHQYKTVDGDRISAMRG